MTNKVSLGNKLLLNCPPTDMKVGLCQKKHDYEEPVLNFRLLKSTFYKILPTRVKKMYL